MLMGFFPGDRLRIDVSRKPDGAEGPGQGREGHQFQPAPITVSCMILHGDPGAMSKWFDEMRFRINQLSVGSWILVGGGFCPFRAGTRENRAYTISIHAKKGQKIEEAARPKHGKDQKRQNRRAAPKLAVTLSWWRSDLRCRMPKAACEYLRRGRDKN